MIGSINGPDAPDAVAWLEGRLTVYWEARVAVDAARAQYRTELAAWHDAGALKSGRPRPPSTIRRLDKATLAAIQLPGVEAMHRPMFEILDDDRYDDDAEASWPRPMPGDGVDLILGVDCPEEEFSA